MSSYKLRSRSTEGQTLRDMSEDSGESHGPGPAQGEEKSRRQTRSRKKMRPTLGEVKSAIDMNAGEIVKCYNR